MTLDARAQFARCVTLTEAISNQLVAPVRDDGVNVTTVTGRVDRLATLDGGTLRELAIAGGSIELVVHSDEGPVARLRSLTPAPSFDVERLRAYEIALDADARLDADEAVACGDVAAFIRATGSLAATVRLQALNRWEITGFTWCRTLDTFLRVPWWHWAERLNPEVYPTTVVIDDLPGRVRTARLRVGGPAILDDPLPPPRPTDVEPSLVARRRGTPDPRAGLATPTDTIVAASDDADRVVAVLDGLTHALTWVWLADDVVPPAADTAQAGLVFRGEQELAVTVDGADALSAALVSAALVSAALVSASSGSTASPKASVNPSTRRGIGEVGLWQWLTAPEHPAKTAGARQSVELALDDGARIDDGAARRVLRNADYLYRLSQQRQVAEALASRRAARQQAVEAGRAASDHLRATVRSTLDRVMVQIAAVAGLVAGKETGALSPVAVRALLAVLLVLIVLAAVVAFFHDLPSATRSVTAFRRDLERFDDTLSPDDVRDLSQLPSLIDAVTEQGRASIMAGVALATAAAVTLTGLVLIS